MDIATRYIATKNGIQPDEVEKADGALGGIAVQLIDRGTNSVVIYTTDSLEQASEQHSVSLDMTTVSTSLMLTRRRNSASNPRTLDPLSNVGQYAPPLVPPTPVTLTHPR